MVTAVLNELLILGVTLDVSMNKLETNKIIFLLLARISHTSFLYSRYTSDWDVVTSCFYMYGKFK